MRRFALAIGLLPAVLAPLPAFAQGGCSAAVIREGETLYVQDRGTPFERIIISGGARITCGADVELRADTATSYPVTGERRFVGRVFYQDSLKTLTADRVNYYDSSGQLVARGSVVLTDRKTGSVIRGAEMDYLRVQAGRPEARTVVRGGRPHATIHEQRDGGLPRDSAAVPVEIDADRLELDGDRLFRAFGRVEIVRGETRGFGSEAEYDQVEDRMVLTGAARVAGDAFTLTAERIDARVRDDALREVHAQHEVELVGEDLRVQAGDMRIEFLDGEIERMVAIRGVAGAAAPQPRAQTEEFWLTADSLDALAPGRKLEQVVAVGNAYGERVADSLDVDLPDLLARDWLRGDTITGHFRQDEVLPADSILEAAADDGAATRTVLDRLVASGDDGRARSLYRMREEEGDPASPISVNYLVANRITLTMRDGRVREVDAEGPVQGIHLQPDATRAPVRPPPASGGIIPSTTRF